MGLLFTDDYYVRSTRKLMHEASMFEVPVSNDDIYVPAESAVTLEYGGSTTTVCGQLSFYGSIVTIHKCEFKDYDRNAIEIWVGDEYINQSEISWVSTQVYDHAILPKRYDDYDAEGHRTMATVRFYSGVFRRYNVKAAKDGSYVHTAIIDFSQPGANLVQNPMCCLFYYADGKLCIPTADMITRRSNTEYVYQIPYTRTLDAFWCWNMVSAHNVKANETFSLHSSELKVTYSNIYVDDDDDYPINTLFYPMVRVDKDSVVRVFSDGAREVPCPEATRIMLYPEYLDIADPYDTDDPHLSGLTPCDVVISNDDTDEEILEKFKELAPFCYRLGEYFPKFGDEQSDFLVLDNSDWSEPYVEECTITRLDGTTEDVIRIIAPFEGYRDILFRNGWIYSDYEVVCLNGLKEDPNGVPYYVIHDKDVDKDRIALLKFNTAEDTVINNLGEWINTDNLLDLHTKVNRLYRNLLILKGAVDDAVEGEEYVRVSSSEPPDQDIPWYEVLSGSEPIDAPDIIKILGLDLHNLPEDLKRALDSLKVNSDDAYEVYYYIMMTYIVHEAERRQIPIGMDLPAGAETSTYNSIPVSTLTSDPLPNDIVVEVSDSSQAEDPITEYYTGEGQPLSSTYDDGDVYLNTEDAGFGFLDGAGNVITMETIAKIPTDTKVNLITEFLNDGSDTEYTTVKEKWNSYLDGMSESMLNEIMYMVLRTKYFYDTYNDINAVIDGEVPKEEAIRHNVEIIVSKNEPVDPDGATAWVNTPNVTVQDYLNRVVLSYLYENYPGLYDDVDLVALVESLDAKAHLVTYGKDTPASPEVGDIWYEFLDDVHNRICYSDETSMVLNLNEQLVLVEFDDDNITAFAFDDILMNFRGKLGIRYMSIVADLINSGVIDRSKVNVFYRRLITASDNVDLGLKRLYNGRPHVVTTANIDTTDLGVLYSTNIGRFHIDYESNDVSNLVREWAWRHVIDYRQMDVSLVPDRMILFVNGRLIPMDDYVDGMIIDDGVERPVAGMLQLTNFDEVIDNIDIFYSVKDVMLSRLKRIALESWKCEIPKVRMLTHTDRDYGKFQPIVAVNHTKKGFYDVLLEEYVLNGKLLRDLDYLKDHPEEFEDYRKDMLSAFHAISDADFINGENVYFTNDENNRIVIPGFGTNQAYQVGVVTR